MNRFFSLALSAASVFALHAPAYAECDQSGHIYSISIDAAGSATLYLRQSGPAATVVFSFAITDPMVLDAALAALPGRSRVKVQAGGTAVCSTGAGAPPIADYIFVTP